MSSKSRSRPDAQAVAFQPHVDHVRAADQDRLGDALFEHDLRGAQHALVLAVGIDDALGLRALGDREDGLHHQARAEDEAVELVDIGVEIVDRARGDAALASSPGDGRRDAQDQARVERRGDQEVRAEGRRLFGIGLGGDVRRLLARKRRDGADGRHLHLLVDGARAAIERSPEDVGEAEHVVDLVGEIRAPGADHGVGPRLAGDLRHDLGRRIGERQDQRLRRHVLQQVGAEHAGGRQAEKDVGAGENVGERAGRRVLDVGVLPAVHLLDAALVGDAETVGDPDVLDLGAERDEEVEAGECGSTRARCDDLDVRQGFSCKLQPVQDGCGDDDRRAVLVVMEDGYAHLLLQPLLHLEAFRRLDVLEVDAAEGGLERRDGAHHALDIGRVDLDVEHVDAGEFLEQDRLAFHHRLGGQRADIAEAEHRGAVGDHADEIGAAGIVGGKGGVVADRQAGRGDAGRIGKRQVALVAERLRRLDLQLSGHRIFVEVERGLVEIETRVLLFVGLHPDPSSPWRCVAVLSRADGFTRLRRQKAARSARQTKSPWITDAWNDRLRDQSQSRQCRQKALT